MPLFHSCAEPFLSGSSRDPFSCRDTLDRFARTAVADQDGNPIRRMKVCADVSLAEMSFLFRFRPSSLDASSLADRTVIEEVGVGSLAVDFEHFRDVRSPGLRSIWHHDMEESVNVARRSRMAMPPTVIGTPRSAANQVGVAQ